MEFNFENKVAIVTGAGQGIGLCIAQYFLQHGAFVVIAERQGELKDKVHKFLNAGKRLLFMPGDVSKEPFIRSVAAKTVRQFGHIDYIIHNAAWAVNEPVEKLSYADWQRVINTNLSGGFLLAKHCKDALARNNGAMVTIASTRALMSEADTEAYSASKGGIVSLTHALAMSLAPKVRVNCISPGWIVTDAYQHGRAKTKLSKADHAQHPAGRVGRPEDIAAMVLYLCSPHAGFITGQNFVIDGGMTRKMIYV